MLDLCALLNRGGGVLLFNCVYEYLDIRPRGGSYLEQDKPYYKYVIKKAIQKIQPKVYLDE
jgi:hypothetical protein